MATQPGASRWQAMSSLSSSLDQQQPPASCCSSASSNRRASAINLQLDAKQQHHLNHLQAGNISLALSGNKDKNDSMPVTSASVQDSTRSLNYMNATNLQQQQQLYNQEQSDKMTDERALATTTTPARQVNGLQMTANKKQEQLELSHSISSGGVRDEADIVFNRLMRLEAFKKLHPSVIRNLCSYAFVERIEKGVIGE